MPVEDFQKALIKAKESGLRNILALRGDPPRGEEWKQIEGGFANAVDLVRFIRKEYGNFFGIAVAGYPEAHIDAVSYEQDLRYLKDKVDAGADVIITQLFYDVDLFLKFVQDCRNIGIKVPIIPGLMPIHAFAGFQRMTTLCKTRVPQAISDALEPIKNDDEAVKEYGVQLAIEMSKKLLAAGIPGLHFYTLNLEKSVHQILMGLNLAPRELRRALPYVAAREHEDVRPIFWSNRPQSYVHRTSSWDEFPNGRWGDSKSPAFGDLTDYHLMSLHATKSFDRLKSWNSTLNSPQDIFDVFSKFCAGEVEKLPWWESPLAPETEHIKDTLVKINKNGFLTINSQPALNGVPSNNEKFGWGPQGGYVYQKAYLEFFVSPDTLKALMDAITRFPDLQYHAVNLRNEAFTNSSTNRPTAVTWGVFPGREVLQPTIVDPDSFVVWKDEAFGLWRSQWSTLYEPGSSSRKVIDNVIDTYFLVNIVDNNFVNGDIFAIFNHLIEKKQKDSVTGGTQ